MLPFMAELREVRQRELAARQPGQRRDVPPASPTSTVISVTPSARVVKANPAHAENLHLNFLSPVAAARSR